MGECKCLEKMTEKKRPCWRVEKMTEKKRPCWRAVKSNSLYLINYESLTMAAQFADVKLPGKHMEELLIKVDNGIYDIRIIQFYNFKTGSYVNRDDIDFLIEIQKTDAIGYVWDTIPWSVDL